MNFDRPRLKALRSDWRKHAKIGPKGDAAETLTVAVTASFTVDALFPVLGSLLLEGNAANPVLLNAEYNQVVSTCLNPAASFEGATPDVIAILWRIEDNCDISNVEAVRESVSIMLSAIRTLRTNFDGMIIVGMPPRPRSAIEGVVEFSKLSNAHMMWYDTSRQTAELADELIGTYLIDVEAAIGRLGEAAALDDRNDMMFRAPLTELALAHIAQGLVMLISMRRLEAKKCLVLDCDNTIWGGVVGEEGAGGISLSDDMPGRGFKEFQRQARHLGRSGVLLALNSKNNPDDVWEAFDKNDAMVLSRDDITASRINWKPKSDNLRQIAKQLNIGIDSLVFVDDSHFEVEEVRTNAPEVTAIHFPEDPAEIPGFFKREIAPLFRRLDITDDDRKRVFMMQKEMERQDLQQSMTTEDFLGSLNLQIDIFRAGEGSLARVVQLINKSNQFNVTTRRYSKAEVVKMMADADTEILCASVRDKFGEYGLVGISILRHGGSVSEIDTLLMSCRVLGRGVETAIVNELRDMARARGASTLLGRHIPTRKNAMVADLFERHDFEKIEEVAETGEKVWSVVPENVPNPDFLTIVRDPSLDSNEASS